MFQNTAVQSNLAFNYKHQNKFCASNLTIDLIVNLNKQRLFFCNNIQKLTKIKDYEGKQRITCAVSSVSSILFLNHCTVGLGWA
jgi:hypothetical protein